MVGSSEFIRGYTEIILCSLVFAEDDYIYNLVNKITNVSNNMIQITNPSTLMIIKKMILDGKVISYDSLNEKGVNRKFYSLTEKGKKYYLDNRDFFLDSLRGLEKLIKGEMSDEEKNKTIY